MSFTDTVGHPLSGNLVLQHKGYNRGKFDLDYRAHKRCVRILERDDTTGSWKLDPDATGDLVLGLCWPQDGKKREMPMWSFGFPTVIAGYSSGGVATPGAAGIPKGRRVSGQMQILPIQANPDVADNRMTPIVVPVLTLRAKGPQGVGKKAGAAGGGGGGGGGAPPKPVNPNQIDSGSKELVLGIGGNLGGFGGQGVGPGSSFATFSGVKTNFSNGSAKAGVSIVDPTKTK